MQEIFNDEDKKMKWLRNYSDDVVSKIQSTNFDEQEALIYLEKVKQKILQKFPEKEQQYELIYGRRFKRLLSKKGVFIEMFSQKITRN
ncbi:MAG: hypothetical protein K9N00_04935 [Candidatus Marinimicrobia bacterium]|nr:hypothetical protein [Candidatus Neomarinimicrobiota bacterium]